MKKNVLILHGWGLQGSTYNALQDLFDKNLYTVYSIDLPGFGQEKLLNENMTLDDYVEFVKKFLSTRHIKSVILVGHSFGGRVSTKLAYTYPEIVDRLVLTGTPIIRHFSIRQKIGKSVAKIGKDIVSILPENMEHLCKKVLYKFIGEYDYLKAGKLKKVLTNIVNEDLQEYARSIKCPVILVWGANDTFTPCSDVEKIKKLIPQAHSVIIENTSHKLPYQNSDLFYKEIKLFI